MERHEPLVHIYAFEAMKLPKFEEVRGKDWVSYGENNMYPQDLINLLLTSAIHNTAVRAKIDATVGEGIVDIGGTVLNSKQETLNEVYEKIAFDKVTFGGYALNVIWNRAGNAIAEIYHIPFANVRSGKIDEENKISKYYFSNNWGNTRKYKPLEYAAFSSTDNRGDNASQIFYAYDYSPCSDIYPLPDYVGAVNDIELDARISRFHNSNISNGLSPSLFINLPNGEPEEDEKRRLWSDITASYAGEDKAGRLFLTFSEGPDLAPQIQTIDPANDDYYVVLEERITSRILTAHRLTSPLLVGIRATGSGLGSNSEEIEVAWVHFTGTVVEPIQKSINRSLEKVLNLMGIFDNTNIEISPSKLNFNVVTNQNTPLQ